MHFKMAALSTPGNQKSTKKDLRQEHGSSLILYPHIPFIFAKRKSNDPELLFDGFHSELFHRRTRKGPTVQRKVYPALAFFEDGSAPRSLPPVLMGLKME